MPTYCILQVRSVHTHTHILIPLEDHASMIATQDLLCIRVSEFGGLRKHPQTTQYALNECHSLHSVVETGH